MPRNKEFYCLPAQIVSRQSFSLRPTSPDSILLGSTIWSPKEMLCPFFCQSFLTTIPLHRADLFPSVPGGSLRSQGSLTTSADCQPRLTVILHHKNGCVTSVDRVMMSSQGLLTRSTGRNESSFFACCGMLHPRIFLDYSQE